MAVPKHRISKTRGRTRRAQTMRLTLPGMGTCGNCGNRVLLHRVCPKCGYYRGKQVIKPEDLA